MSDEIGAHPSIWEVLDELSEVVVKLFIRVQIIERELGLEVDDTLKLEKEIADSER